MAVKFSSGRAQCVGRQRAAAERANGQLWSARRALCDEGPGQEPERRFPARKTVILITGGFPLTPEIMSEATAAISACNKANVAIYPIDVRGLVAGTPAARLSAPIELRQSGLASQSDVRFVPASYVRRRHGVLHPAAWWRRRWRWGRRWWRWWGRRRRACGRRHWRQRRHSGWRHAAGGSPGGGTYWWRRPDRRGPVDTG